MYLLKLRSFRIYVITISCVVVFRFSWNLEHIDKILPKEYSTKKDHAILLTNRPTNLPYSLKLVKRATNSQKSIKHTLFSFIRVWKTHIASKLIRSCLRYFLSFACQRGGPMVTYVKQNFQLFNWFKTWSPCIGCLSNVVYWFLQKIGLF